VKAVVLVGGEGTRLRPLTLTRPKQMLPVGRVPMIERVLEWLAAHGVSQAVLSLGYRPDAFLAAYPEGRFAGVELIYAVEDTPLDTAGAVRFAASVGEVAETFVVVNGDVLTDLDIGALVDFHRQRGAAATIALTPVRDPSAFGVVPTDHSGRVTAFIEKPSPGSAPTNLINAGTYVLEAEVLKRIPEGRRVSIERETFPALVAEASLYAMASEADWVDAGTPASYLAANLRYAGPPGEDCRVAARAKIDDCVIGKAVTILEGAALERCVLMDHVVVGAGCCLNDCLIGERVVIGEGCRLSGLAVVGDGQVVPPATLLDGQRIPSWP